MFLFELVQSTGSREKNSQAEMAMLREALKEQIDQLVKVAPELFEKPAKAIRTKPERAF